MGAGGKIRIATHVEVDWLEQSFAPAVCPNCGTAGLVRRYLDIDPEPILHDLRAMLKGGAP